MKNWRMLNSLNNWQKEAVLHGSGPALILAGPGSGKTTVIIQRIQYLIWQLSIPPSQILVISFTKAAAKEMQQRFIHLTNEQYLPVAFGTFHSVFYQILKQYFHYEFSQVITPKEKNQYIKTIMEQFYPETVCDRALQEEILSLISKRKSQVKESTFISEGLLEGDRAEKVFTEYCKRLRMDHKVDFDDMVRDCYQLLKEKEDILQKVREQFRYLMIDEFQDIGEMQYEVIKLICKPYNNLFAVGDDDQAIYGFRGASPAIMMEFMETFPEAKRICLNVNYRCPAEIVTIAGNLISCNKKRLSKEIISCHQESTKACYKKFFESSREEYDFLIKEMQRLQTDGRLQECVILVRTNAAKEALSELLTKERITVKKEETFSIYEHPIIVPILSCLKFACKIDTSRSIFLQFMNTPMRYIEREWLKVGTVDLVKMAEELPHLSYMQETLLELQGQLDVISKLSAYGAVMFFCNVMGYEKWLLSKYHDENRAKKILHILSEIKKSSKQFGSIREWLCAIEKMDNAKSKVSISGDMNKNVKSGSATDEKATDALTIMTMHSAKGLEFKNVYIPDINEGNIPHGKNQTTEEMEEERRLFYVALTRTKEKLWLLSVKNTKEKPAFPSRFLKELSI